MEDIGFLYFKYFSILQITFSYINDNQFVIPHYYIFIAWWWERYVYKDLLSENFFIFRRPCHSEIRFTLGKKSVYLPHHYVILFWYWTRLYYTTYVEFIHTFSTLEKKRFECIVFSFSYLSWIEIIDIWIIFSD